MREGQLPEPPQCTPWCRTPGSGWDVSVGSVTKTCRCVIESAPDEDGEPFTVSLERFARVEGDRVYVEEPRIQLPSGSRYRPDAVAFICETIGRAVDVLDAPARVA